MGYPFLSKLEISVINWMLIMINLTLPKWLHPKDSVREKPQTTHDDSINNNPVNQLLTEQEYPPSTHLSLTYLDDYIHQWF